MIRFSALLVALAIGLLAAGVAASSLPLVYVSIAVCAVAALLLAAGVLRHWSEIFGPRTQRVASPFAASGPVPSPATAGRASAGRAAPGHAATAGRARPVGAPGLAGFRADAGAGPAVQGPEPAVAAGRYRAAADPDGRADRVPADPAARAASAARGVGGRAAGQDEADSAARGDRRSGRKGWPARRPAEPEPVPAPAEPINAAPTDDLWDRVNEELESAGKRDSGRLSWPAGDFSIPSGMSLPAEPPEQETFAGPGRPGSGDLWPPAAGWQPPSTPPSSWPFAPSAEPASAGSAGRDSDRETGTEAAASEAAASEAAAGETVAAAEPPGPAQAGRGARGWDARSRVEADQSAEVDQSTGTPGEAQRDPGADENGAADQDAAPRWTIRPQAGPGTASTVVSTPPVVTPRGDAEAAETKVVEPAEAAEATEAAEAAESAKAAEPGSPAEPGPAAEPAEAGSASEVDDAGPPEADAAADETGADGAAPGKPAKPAGPVQVTVVPGVARYHRSECILIRFLGEDDLETMPKQQAVADGLIACRACQPDELPDS